VITGLRKKTIVGVTGLAVLATGLTGSPARADVDTGTAIVNVEVTGAITVTGLASTFTIVGAPGVLAQNLTTVTMKVFTNNLAGYSVTLAAAASNLTGTSPNTDVIPTNSLRVKGPQQGLSFVPLTFGTPLLVASKGSPSDPGGDDVANGFRLTIPAVLPDTYSGALDYLVTTL
jgi:hypothetical protein